MSESEYKELVLADYDRKKATGKLTSELMDLTPGNLKAESVKICERRFDPKDELLLISFFNKRDDVAGYHLAIQNHNADIFRPVVKFIKEREINTALRNINMLAWLIDFQPRPYHINLKVPIRPDKPVRPAGTGGNDTELHKESWLLKNKKKVILYSALAVVLFTGGYLIKNRTISGLTGHEGCMIWAGNQYEPIACDQKRGNLPVFKLDTQKVADFKRVKTDTLSPRAIGHVWYAKFGGQIEFYSDSGQHPVDTNKRLLPLTSHILNKYVFHVADPK